MRHRTLRLLSLGLLLSALSACSYMTDFIVVNDSGSPVEVRYTFKAAHYSGPPAKKPLDKLDDDHTPWRKVPEGEFSNDPGARAITVTLGPGEALRVFEGANWRSHGDRDDDDSFALDSVRITGANGVVEYEGRQAQYQFQWKDDSLYQLTYYGWGDKRHDGGR
jgi:hypothetical protein